MTAAIFGLLGVVLGGSIQGGGAWLMARRGDRQIVRGAARMTAGELMRGVHRITELLDAGVWGAVKNEPLESPRWREHEPLFAAIISDDETWRDIYNAYRYFDHINEQASRSAGRQRLTDAERDELDRCVHLAMIGALALTSIGIYGPARWSLRRLLGRVHGRLRPPNEEQMLREVEERLDPRLGDEPSS